MSTPAEVKAALAVLVRWRDLPPQYVTPTQELDLLRALVIAMLDAAEEAR